MNELIENKINELYSLIMDKPNQVLEIFNNFFGEDKVDMQGFIDIDELKSWIGTASISEYVPQRILNMSAEDYNIYGSMTLTDLHGKTLDKVLKVLCDYETVENIGHRKFESGFILVHFPQVRITNEYNKFVDIDHLYAKVNILFNGSMSGRFLLNRAEYSYLHISNDYMHSHVNSIPTNDFTKFQIPCLGDGPIKDTILTLNKEFDPDIWGIFCLELSKYVEVESVSGTPYHRLEYIVNSHRNFDNNIFKVINNLNCFGSVISREVIKEFVSHFIRRGKLKFNYINGSYGPGMSFIEYILTISNEFIDWYNYKFNKGELLLSFDKLRECNVLKECIIARDKLYYERSFEHTNIYASYNGRRMCTFKGQDVNIIITNTNKITENNKSIILNTNISLYILSKILCVINYRYGRSEQGRQKDNRIGGEVKYF